MTENVRKRANTQDLEAVESPEGIARTTVAYATDTMLCHFKMKKGASIPLHHHPAAQTGYIISGKVKFKTGDGSSTFIAGPGCGYAFESEEPHGAEVLEDSEVLEVFAPMRPEYADN
ncbi:MAG: cupin domain-containing protein [Spirochaetales bacterium]|jgi:quercetin dioxygenase-like cupin family protein|nr:cupin domain-containing protein [Spirochaetales bacterium]